MIVKRIYAVIALAAVGVVGCQQAFAECGIASTYNSGSRTANGERYNHMGVSAAHKSLPFGSQVVVRNQHTGRSITVRINDRGPFISGRIIDLSTGAKNALGMGGLAPVCLEVVSYGGGRRGLQTAQLRHSTRSAHSSHRRHYAGVHSSRRRHFASGHGRMVRYVRVHHRPLRARGSAKRRSLAANN